jgi:hypothetical protein
MECSLTEKVLKYQKTGLGLDRIVEAISLRIYRYPQRRFGWDEDDSSEFFLSFYQRIPALVTRWRFTGVPFEAYLFASVRWQMRSFRIKQKAETLLRRTGERDEFWLTVNADDTFETERSTEPENAGNPDTVFGAHAGMSELSSAVKKRLLYLTMKGALYLEQHHLKRIAYLIGVPYEQLERSASALRERLDSRLERLESLREKRNRAFFKLRCLEQKLAQNSCIETVRNDLMRRIEIERRRMHEAQYEIARTPRMPSHKDIAEVLGVPKGSVDSGLYYLKESASELYQEPEKRYA